MQEIGVAILVGSFRVMDRFDDKKREYTPESGRLQQVGSLNARQVPPRRGILMMRNGCSTLADRKCALVDE